MVESADQLIALSPLQGLKVTFETAVEAIRAAILPAIALGLLTAFMTVTVVDRGGSTLRRFRSGHVQRG
jgi:uncharacterized protein GlcG (DUF336 family)